MNNPNVDDELAHELSELAANHFVENGRAGRVWDSLEVIVNSYCAGLDNPLMAHARAVMLDEGLPAPEPEYPSPGTIGYAYGLAMGALGVDVEADGQAELHPDGSRRE